MDVLALGLPGIALALVLRLSLKEPRRGSFDVRSAALEPPSFVAVLTTLKGCRTYRFAWSFYVLNGFVQYGLIQWWPSFYDRASNLGMSSVGLYLALAIGGSAATGSLIGGGGAGRECGCAARSLLASEHWSHSNYSCYSDSDRLFVPSIQLSIMLVSLTALYWSVSNRPVLAVAATVVSPEMRATSSSLLIFGAAVLGFGLGPLCVGGVERLADPIAGTRGSALRPSPANMSASGHGARDLWRRKVLEGRVVSPSNLVSSDLRDEIKSGFSR